MGIDPPFPLVTSGSGDQDYYGESPGAEEDVLQDYYQQALLLDGLQCIDRWTYIIQDWDERLGILGVSLSVSPLDQS